MKRGSLAARSGFSCRVIGSVALLSRASHKTSKMERNRPLSKSLMRRSFTARPLRSRKQRRSILPNSNIQSPGRRWTSVLPTLRKPSRNSAPRKSLLLRSTARRALGPKSATPSLLTDRYRLPWPKLSPPLPREGRRRGPTQPANSLPFRVRWTFLPSDSGDFARALY